MALPRRVNGRLEQRRVRSEGWRVFFVYCLESESHFGEQYIGFSEDLRRRLGEHNNGSNPSTQAGRPWKLRGYVAFDEKAPALEFERYLKTGSGHAFRKKRLW